MEWMFVAAGLIVVGALWFVLRPSDQDIPPDARIDPEALEDFLSESGIDLGSTRNPDPEILRSHIASDDTLVGAVEGRTGSKRAYVVLLGDRLVVGEATIGRMGAEVQSIPFHHITDFEQGYDIGGTFHFDTEDADLTVTHVPRSKTRDFAGLVRNRIGDQPTAE
jgi:hypothetical protein